MAPIQKALQAMRPAAGTTRRKALPARPAQALNPRMVGRLIDSRRKDATRAP